MFYLFKHALIITKISVLVRVGIRWILGGVMEELVGEELVWEELVLDTKKNYTCVYR